MLVAIALAGCGVGVHSDPANLGSNGGHGSGSAMPGTCNDPDGPLHPYTQAADLEALVIGTWRQCSGPTLFNTPQAGVEIATDGTFYLLADSSGTLVRKGGFESQGTWDASQETAQTVQLNFHIANTGTDGYPQFEDNPRKMQFRIFENPDPSLWVLAE